MKTKKTHLFSLVLGLMMLCVPAHAGDLRVELFEEAIGGIFWDWNEGDMLAGGITHVITWKYLLSADIGVLGDTETGRGAFAGGLGVDLKTASEMAGLDYHLPGSVVLGGFGSYDFEVDKLRFGLYGGWAF